MSIHWHPTDQIIVMSTKNIPLNGEVLKIAFYNNYLLPNKQLICYYLQNLLYNQNTT